MREIKFRAWDGEKMSSSFTLKQALYRTDTWDDFGENWDGTFMQYTGIKDKNDKEIYEGDVLGVYLDEIPPMDNDTKKELHGVMVNPSIIHGREAQWKYYQVRDMISLHLNNQDYGPFSIDLDSYEIIGNIYENPELLTNKPTNDN